MSPEFITGVKEAAQLLILYVNQITELQWQIITDFQRNDVNGHRL